MGWPSRARPGSTGTASAATTRCWPLWPAPATCCTPGCGRAWPTPGVGRAASWPRRSPGRAGPGGPITLRADSGFYNHKVIDACHKAGVACSVTIKLTKAVHKVIAQIPEGAWTPIPYWLEGGADVAETSYRPFGRKGRVMRLIVRRVRPTPGSQLALFCDYDYHGFVTDREGETLALEADHRRHAEVENTIRDLKYGVGLNHLPSGKFAANAAWLTLNVLAHNLARWTSRIGLGETLITTKTLRTRYLDLPGRLTRSARRWHLHLPTRWPWAHQFLLALDRLRCVPFPT